MSVAEGLETAFDGEDVGIIASAFLCERRVKEQLIEERDTWERAAHYWMDNAKRLQRECPEPQGAEVGRLRALLRNVKERCDQMPGMKEDHRGERCWAPFIEFELYDLIDGALRSEEGRDEE